MLWKTGSLELDYEDSAAEQLAPAEHWPQLRIMVLVVRHGFQSFLVYRTCCSYAQYLNLRLMTLARRFPARKG